MIRFAKAPLGAIAAVAMTLPVAAPAQMTSPAYQFLKAVRDNDGGKVDELIGKPGANVIDSRDFATGQTALHIVIARRDLTWTSYMLGKGARVDAQDKDGNTPLMIAAQLGFADGAALLIRRRARIDLDNNSGETPLIRAVQLRDIRMVKLLMTAGANPDKADTLAGLSARDYAKRDSRNPAVLKAIEDGKVTDKPSAIGPN